MDSLVAVDCLHFLTLAALFFSISVAAAVTSPNNTQPPHRLVMKLIHHDSITSPFYNSTESVSDLAERFLRNAYTRSMFLDSKASAQANLILDSEYTIFSVEFSVGQPPVPQIALMDTGSSLLWIQCNPCEECFQQSNPIFDSSKSSTYKEFPCNDPLCIQYRNARCNSQQRCGYGIKYMDSSMSEGTLALEQLSFQGTHGDVTVVSNVLIGCGRDNYEESRGNWAGVFGLGNAHPNDLVNQLGNKFSYCVGSVTDHQYSYNQLVVGDAANMEGYRTPIQKMGKRYFVTLEGVSVGEERLDIDPDVFKPDPQGRGGLILDSGSILTRLTENAYDILKEGVDDVVGWKLNRFIRPKQPKMLCYRGDVRAEMTGFPAVSFHFAGGADLVMDEESMFFQANTEHFCMAVLPLKPGVTSIIGITAQQNYNVGYDLNAGMMYLERIDCELLSD